MPVCLPDASNKAHPVNSESAQRRLPSALVFLSLQDANCFSFHYLIVLA